jgi:hypothetical protein
MTNLECMVDKFPKYHLYILLGDFSGKGGMENIFHSQFRMKVYVKVVMLI